MTATSKINLVDKYNPVKEEWVNNKKHEIPNYICSIGEEITIISKKNYEGKGGAFFIAKCNGKMFLIDENDVEINFISNFEL